MGKIVFTIGRDFGSGGREIGMALSERLGIECYDSRLIDIAAERGGMDVEKLRESDERKSSFWFYTVPLDPNYISIYDRPMNEVLFNLQSQIIRDLADMDSCIIIGRCADHVLRDRSNVFSIHIYADLQFRIDRIMKKYAVDAKEAEAMIRKVDRQRDSYYKANTGKNRRDKDNYHLLIDSGKFGIDRTVEMLHVLYAALKR